MTHFMTNPLEAAPNEKHEDNSLEIERLCKVGDSVVLKSGLNEYLRNKIPMGVESGKKYRIEKWPSDAGAHTVFVRDIEDEQAPLIETPVSLVEQAR